MSPEGGDGDKPINAGDLNEVVVTGQRKNSTLKPADNTRVYQSRFLKEKTEPVNNPHNKRIKIPEQQPMAS